MRGICRIVKNGDVVGVMVADDRDVTSTMTPEEYVNEDIAPPLSALDACAGMGDDA